MASHHGQGYLYPHGAFTGAMVSRSDYVYRVWRELSLCFCTGHQPQYRRRLKQDILRYRAHRHCWLQGPLSTVRTIHRTIPLYMPSSASQVLVPPFPNSQRCSARCRIHSVYASLLPKQRNPPPPCHTALTILIIGFVHSPPPPPMSTGRATPIPLALITKLTH